LEVYQELLKQEDPDPLYYTYSAACCYYMGLYKEAEEHALQVWGHTAAVHICSTCRPDIASSNDHITELHRRLQGHPQRFGPSIHGALVAAPPVAMIMAAAWSVVPAGYSILTVALTGSVNALLGTLWALLLDNIQMWHTQAHCRRAHSLASLLCRAPAPPCRHASFSTVPTSSTTSPSSCSTTNS
jgi:hypothetical protein